jgi:oligopeptide transport system ATP-binding protein
MVNTKAKEEPILEVRNLAMHFPVTKGMIFSRVVGQIRAVDGVDFFLRRGETLGLVGESGCGKSTLARAVTQLYRPTSGSVLLHGEELTSLPGRAMRRARMKMQMIFQDPFASLDPRMTVGATVGEPLRNFGIMRRAELRDRVAELFEEVGLSPTFVNRYPHEFSGGQRQRIGIARALAIRPDIIFADEPISALDVSIQAQVVNLLLELREKHNLSYLFIAHDLSMVRHISDRVAVMYLGRIVELANYHDIYHSPLHPYTRALLSAIPIPDPEIEARRRRVVLKGDVPRPDKVFTGCRFQPRCPDARPECKDIDPPLSLVAPDHYLACILEEPPGNLRLHHRALFRG